MQSTQLLLVPGSVTPSFSSFSPALTDLAALLFPTLSLHYEQPAAPLSLLSPQWTPSPHSPPQPLTFPRASLSVSALLLSSALLTVNFADIPVYLGDTKGETRRSVALGKSPLPTHRGVGLLPQCVQKEGWQKPEQLKFCSTLGFSEFLPQLGT